MQRYQLHHNVDDKFKARNNRLKKVTFPDTNYTENTYDLAGRRTQFRNARAKITTFGYDNAYRLTSVTDPLNHTKTFGYDLMSNLTSQTDALGNTTNFEYDDFNRLEKIIYPPSATGLTRLEESMTYDKLGNVKTRVDTAGRTTSYDYDDLNRLTKITDALTNQTQFEYNLRSQMTKVKDALNQEYLFTYDPLGRVLSQTRAGTTMTFEYDAVGNRTKRTDHNSNVTNYTYDNLNRLTGGPLGTYTYDDISQMLTATNYHGTVSFTYDNRGRVDTTTDVYGKVLDYDYDADGNRTLMKLDGTSFTSYTYDDAGRIASQTNVPESATVTYGYDLADKLISKALPNGITTVYEYDDMSRLKRIKDQNSGGTLTDREYTYNYANQIASIILPNRTRTYTYDNIDRLTGVTDSISGSVESYAYDAVGNRTSSHLSSTYTYDPFNRLVATDSESYTYDNNGSMSTRTDANGTFNLFHDGDGRFYGGYKFDESTFEFEYLDYRYDALGRRIYRQQPWMLPTSFTYDGDDVLLSNMSGSVTSYQNGPGIDNRLSTKLAGGSGSSSYSHRDHLGTQIAGSTSAGVLTGGTSIPDSFGYGIGGFTGREYDSYLEIQYSRARMYDPELGRFISEDPIGFAAGDINLYGYVLNRPTMFRDPSGKVIPAIIIGGVVVGGLILASPSPVNAPGPNDPVYYPDNPLLLNAAGGQALGMACGYAFRAVSPFISRLLAGTGDDIITLGIAGGPDPILPSSVPPSPVAGLPRVGSGLKNDIVRPEIDGLNNIVKEFPATPKGHGFPDIVDNYAGLAQRFNLRQGADLYQLPGSNNGATGRFEWIIDGGRVTHRYFVANGTINGIPTIP